MSQITENTIVFKPEAEAVFLRDVEANKDCFYSNSVRKVFENKDFMAYVFDCNGDMPWQMGGCELGRPELIAMETSYGDDDGYWTTVEGSDTPEGVTLTDWMKTKLTEEEFKVYSEKTQFTECFQYHPEGLGND